MLTQPRVKRMRIEFELPEAGAGPDRKRVLPIPGAQTTSSSRPVLTS
jgi:hypothetical protein